MDKFVEVSCESQTSTDGRVSRDQDSVLRMEELQSYLHSAITAKERIQGVKAEFELAESAARAALTRASLQSACSMLGDGIVSGDAHAADAQNTEQRAELALLDAWSTSFSSMFSAACVELDSCANAADNALFMLSRPAPSADPGVAGAEITQSIDGTPSDTIALSEVSKICAPLDALLHVVQIPPGAPRRDAIVLAARGGDNAVLCALLVDERVRAELKTDHLMDAVRSRCVDAVRTLLRNLVSPNAMTDSVLFKACEIGCVDVVTELLAVANIHPEARNNRSLRVAIECNHVGIVSLLLEHESVSSALYADVSCLLLACCKSHGPMIALLLARANFDTYVVDYVLSSVLKQAVDVPTFDVNVPLALLLSDPRVTLAHVQRHLFEAACAGCDRVVAYVLKFTADNVLFSPNARVQSFGRAFSAAAAHGRAGVVRLLLADPRVDPSVDDNHAVQTAMDRMNPATVIALLQDPRVDPCAISREHVQRVFQSSNKLQLARALAVHPRFTSALLRTVARNAIHTELRDLRAFLRTTEQPNVMHVQRKQGEQPRVFVVLPPLVSRFHKKMSLFFTAALLADLDEIHRALSAQPTRSRSSVKTKHEKEPTPSATAITGATGAQKLRNNLYNIS